MDNFAITAADAVSRRYKSNDPEAMAQAVSMIVHKGATDKEAYEFFLDTKKN